MTTEQMLTRLQSNYQILETQFQKTDLSTIPAAKLVELMLRHALAIQKAAAALAKPTDPPTASKPAKVCPSNPAPIAQPNDTSQLSASPGSVQTKTQNSSPARNGVQNLKIFPTPSDPTQDILDRLRERSESLPTDVVRCAGILPPPPVGKEPPYNPYRHKITVPPPSPSS